MIQKNIGCGSIDATILSCLIEDLKENQLTKKRRERIFILWQYLA
jgi:hypothetical protein